MIDPTRGDHTFSRTYEVEAPTESKAYQLATDIMNEVDDPEYGKLKHRSIFNYIAKEI